MKDGTPNLFAALLAAALVCPLASCATSAPISDGTGGSTGSGGSGSGGSGSGGATGGTQGTGGNGSTGGSGSGGSVATSGCGGKATGSGGQAGNGSAATGGAAGASPYANFTTIQQIVQYKCGGSSCHNSVQNPMFMDDSNLYSALTTSKAPDCMNYLLVKAGDPTHSAMYLAISDACPCVPQMPDGCTGGDPNGPTYSCLPPDYIEGVRQWIANGAHQQ
jgi:hypothetical protein